MEEIAGWIAPVATMIAAMMTAANLGTRITGWGFVLFTVGSVGWTTVAVASGQGNLLWTNIFLTVVNLAGIWRWLGRQARVEDAADADVARSRDDAAAAPMFATSGLQGRAVLGDDGARIATAVEALADCRTGRIDHLIVSVGGVGGVGETLHRLDWGAVRTCDDTLTTGLDAAGARALATATRP